MKTAIFGKTQLKRVCTEKGESIEEMMLRLTTTNEPVPANVQQIYTPRSEGVIPDYDIRTDRFNIAYDATDKFTASQRAKAAQMETTNDISKTENE